MSPASYRRQLRGTGVGSPPLLYLLSKTTNRSSQARVFKAQLPVPVTILLRLEKTSRKKKMQTEVIHYRRLKPLQSILNKWERGYNPTTMRKNSQFSPSTPCTKLFCPYCIFNFKTIRFFLSDPSLCKQIQLLPNNIIIRKATLRTLSWAIYLNLLMDSMIHAFLAIMISIRKRDPDSCTGYNHWSNSNVQNLPRETGPQFCRIYSHKRCMYALDTLHVNEKR